MIWKKRKSESLYKKISYSQCGEDLIVKHIFDSLKILNPSYLDIGAHHPYYLSNTALFYQNGCHGINIEPDPQLFAEICIERKRDLNLNIGIGENESISDFYIMNVSTLNTFSKSIMEQYSKENKFYVKSIEKIKIMPLSYILKFTNNIFPDFLSIDAEGVEDLMIKGLSEIISKPKVICIETISFSEKGQGIKQTKLIDQIVKMGYLQYADTNINTIFVLENLWKRI